MIKKITCLILTISLMVLLSITAFAAYDKPNLVDDANLLSSQEYDETLKALNEVSEKYGVVIAAITVNDINGLDIVDFADKYQEEHYSKDGSNEPLDGVLLVVDMGSRQWYVTTYGEGVKAFTDYGIQELNDDIMSYFKVGDFATGFKRFAEVADDYFKAEREGTPVDYGYQQSYEKKPTSTVGWIVRALIAVFGGFGLSFAVTASMKKKMQTVVPVKDADNYIDTDKSILSKSTDRYLYHNLVVVPLPRDNGSKGGSSTHFSAGGFSHGGGGGHF